MIYKILSSMIICVGCLSFTNGIAIPVMADAACDDGEFYQGLECDPAHAIHRHLAQSLNVDCFGNSSSCTAGTNSQCGTLEGFQMAGKGLCVATFDTEETDTCTEDAYSTFVALDYYTTACGVKDGNCTCLFYHDASHPTQYSEVCDCML